MTVSEAAGSPPADTQTADPAPPAAPTTATRRQTEAPPKRNPISAEVPPAPHRPHRALRLLAPGALFLAIRGTGILIFWWLANANNADFSLRRWDGSWYLAIAQHGYPGVPQNMLDLYGHHNPTTPMVFFPGYPQLVGWTAVLVGHNYTAAGIAISTIAGVAAAYGVARLARRYTNSPRTTIAMVVLFAAAPMSIVYSMTYPEALLCAFTAWALVGLSERKWGVAGICTAAAGYVSPMAAPLIIAVVVVALIDLFKDRARWNAVAAILMAPAGMLGYLLWVGSTTGRGDGYFVVQKQGWGSGFDFGRATAQWFIHTWSTDRSAFTILTTWIVIAAVLLLVMGARHKMPWQPWLFAALTLVFVLGSSGIQWDKARLLLVAFPLLLPIAITVARQRTSTMILLLLGFTFAGLWFGAYALTVWQFSV
jgi:hypothetical protein